MRVDLNCDLGEGVATDGDLLRYVTSANIACGMHAGDADTMRATLAAAAAAGVAAGAHPGFADREHFGRRELPLSEAEVYELVAGQVSALAGMAAAVGTALRHVKPHGALYNMAARDRGLADAIARAVQDVGAGLALYGLAGSELLPAATRAGLRAVSECFADRNYLSDGSLVPRSRPDALLTDAVAAAARVVRMVGEGRMRAVDGTDIAISAETICIHGDGNHAVAFARELRLALEAAGVDIVAPASG